MSLYSLIRPDEMGRREEPCRERESGSEMEQRRLSYVSLIAPLDFSHRFYTSPFVSPSTVSTALQEPSPKTQTKLDPYEHTKLALLNWGSSPSSCTTPRTGGKLRVAVAGLPLG